MPLQQRRFQEMRSAARQNGQCGDDRRLLLRKPLDQITEFRLEQNYGEALQLLQTRLTQTLCQ
jgi:hypothetical protein